MIKKQDLLEHCEINDFEFKDCNVWPQLVETKLTQEWWDMKNIARFICETYAIKSADEKTTRIRCKNMNVRGSNIARITINLQSEVIDKIVFDVIL